MVRGKPPPGLDRLRELLDTAAVRRVLLPHDSPADSPGERAALLSLALNNVAYAQFAEADGDLVVAVIPGDRRLDLAALAAAVGARRARLVGAEEVRRRFSYEPSQVPLLTGLPTVIERSLLTREFVFGSTGDPLWTLRIASVDLRRATNAIAAAIVRPG